MSDMDDKADCTFTNFMGNTELEEVDRSERAIG